MSTACHQQFLNSIFCFNRDFYPSLTWPKLSGQISGHRTMNREMWSKLSTPTANHQIKCETKTTRLWVLFSLLRFFCLIFNYNSFLLANLFLYEKEKFSSIHMPTSKKITDGWFGGKKTTIHVKSISFRFVKRIGEAEIISSYHPCKIIRV